MLKARKSVNMYNSMCVMCKGMYVYFNVCVHVTVMNFVNNQFIYIIHYVSFRSLYL